MLGPCQPKGGALVPPLEEGEIQGVAGPLGVELFTRD
jgi:hypothetical protein